MRIALPSSGDDIKLEVSRVFGRARSFIIAELKDGEIESFNSIANPAEPV